MIVETVKLKIVVLVFTFAILRHSKYLVVVFMAVTFALNIFLVIQNKVNNGAFFLMLQIKK